MFHDSIQGAQASAVIYSISETAKLNNLRPYYYFKHLLTELPKLCDEKGNIDSTKQSTAKAVFKAYLSEKNNEEIAKELKMPLEEVEELLAW